MLHMIGMSFEKEKHTKRTIISNLLGLSKAIGFTMFLRAT